jgi:predicted transcriptional regulator
MNWGLMSMGDIEENEEPSTTGSEGGITKRLQTELEICLRHVLMLQTIKSSEPIGIIRLAELLRHPQHKIRYSLRILEQEGLIRPSPEGAVTTEKVGEFLPQLKSVLLEMEVTVRKLRESLGP